jgi:tetratricopeptide (TPR) repeat protein
MNCVIKTPTSCDDKLVIVVSSPAAPIAKFVFRLAAIGLALIAGQSGQASAAERDDCGPRPTEATERACTVILDDSTRPVADHVRAYVNQARALLGSAQVDRAFSDADAALKLDPRSVPALLERGFASQRKKNLDAARSDFDTAIGIDPNFVGGYISRGNLSLALRNWAEASKDFDTALHIMQDSAPAHAGRGRVYLETGDLDKAMAELNTAIAINADFPYAYFWRGQIYRRMGDLDHGIVDFTRAIAQGNRKDVSNLFARGRLYVAMGDYAKALTDFHSILEIEPDNVEAQQSIRSAQALQSEVGGLQDRSIDRAVSSVVDLKTAGAGGPSGSSVQDLSGQDTQRPDRVATSIRDFETARSNTGTAPDTRALTLQGKQLLDQGKYGEAIDVAGRALAADPHSRAALMLRVVGHIGLNHAAEARADLDELLRLKPDDALVLSMHGWILASLKQVDLGMNDIDRAIQLGPTISSVYKYRGMVERQLRKYPEALADFDRAIAINPKDSFLYSDRGQTRIAMSEPGKSLVDFDQALALNQHNEQARAARGLALLLRGNTAEGISDLNAALERNPDNLIALLGRGLAMLISNQPDRAVVALNQVIAKTPDNGGARLLRARAFLAMNDLKAAMADAEAVSAVRADDPDLHMVRGLILLNMHDYRNALLDLDQAIEKRESAEGYIARGRAYEASNEPERAASDFRHALQFPPKNVFDVAAQTVIKQKVNQLSKRIPCGTAGVSDTAGTCL